MTIRNYCSKKFSRPRFHLPGPDYRVAHGGVHHVEAYLAGYHAGDQAFGIDEDTRRHALEAIALDDVLLGVESVGGAVEFELVDVTLGGRRLLAIVNGDYGEMFGLVAVEDRLDQG